MCSQYWNLTADIAAPCGHEVKQANLQTHFMGEYGSCSNYYNLGDQVPELRDYTGFIAGDPDGLIGDCDKCDGWFTVNVEAQAGRVVRVVSIESLQ